LASVLPEESALGKRLFRLLLIGRSTTAAAILILIFGIAWFGPVGNKTIAPIGLISLAFMLTLPYHVLGNRVLPDSRTLSLVVVGIDTAFLTAGLYLVGPRNAAYGLPIYGVLIVMAAVVHSGRGSFLIAFLSAALLATMFSAVAVGVLPERPDLLDLAHSTQVASVSVSSALFLGVAMAAVASSLTGMKDSALRRAHQYEAQLLDLNLTLERRIAASVGDIQTYARAIAHDLRNPLTAALELSRLGSSSQDLVRGERFFEMARENLLRADDMLMGLRNLMRIGARSEKPEPVNLVELVDGLRLEFGGDPGFQIFVESELGTLEIDRPRLEHVIRNLLMNAVEHNSEKDDLQVTLGRMFHRDEVRYYVRDNGSGFPVEMQERVFSPFWRGVDSKDLGVGLGLALVDSIIRRAGGRVWCEGGPGVGATFWFALPALSAR